MPITRSHYGTLKDGRPVEQYTLGYAGLCCKVITYGGIITELHVPDSQGNLADVVLGFGSLEEYESGHPYFGCITGRVAGRINGDTFELDSKQYELSANQHPNHLHGGDSGFDKKLWQAEASENDKAEPTLTLRYRSPDGEEGYPGTLDIEVTYSIQADASLVIEYTATTDKATPVSATNHSYFNLAGEGTPTIGDHHLQVLADTMVTAAEDGTLSDAVTSVEGTIHDFQESRKLADFVAPPHQSHGENYMVADTRSDMPKLVAVVHEPNAGRTMEVLTTERCVQLYTGKFLSDTELVGKSGITYPSFSAVCLECQGYPNGINAPHIDDIVLRPNETYRQTTIYRFPRGS